MRLLLILALMASLFCIVVGADHAVNAEFYPMRSFEDPYRTYMRHIRYVANDLVSPIVLPAAMALVCISLLFRRTERRAPTESKPRNAWSLPDD